MNNVIITVKDFDIEEVERIMNRINAMPIGTHIVTNASIEIKKINRVWVNPFYCRNFAIFWKDVEFDAYYVNLYRYLEWYNMMSYQRW